ncbi:unnamed protein product [Caenorhabditis sp. 36 PRJEB53466]|nr:unnamed protein product [Caenorhabditis sp. 36 PRJEB53466]
MSSMTFDGEAPETDDELENEADEEEQPRKTAEEMKNEEKKDVSIDKNLKKRWSKAAADTINTCQKRISTQEKTMQKVTESAADCFTSMQNVAAKLNNVHSNVARLEDSVADLIDASRLIPSRISEFKLNIFEFL